MHAVHVLLCMTLCVELTPQGIKHIQFWFPVGKVASSLTVYCFTSIVSLIAPLQAEGGGAGLVEDSEVEVVYVREPTAEQAALARKLLLPLTFFCYQNEPGYTSDDQTDGEATAHKCSLSTTHRLFSYMC